MTGHEIRLSQLFRVLQKLESNSPISPGELGDAKTIAAELYFRHNNRNISLNNEEFELVVSILEHKS